MSLYCCIIYNYLSLIFNGHDEIINSETIIYSYGHQFNRNVNLLDFDYFYFVQLATNSLSLIVQIYS